MTAEPIAIVPPTRLPVGPANCWLLRGGPLTLVDTDPGAPGALEALERGLAAAGFDRQPKKERARCPARQFVLPRALRAISNLERWLQGTRHGVSPKHLQVYLGEFVFRHKQRRTPLAAFQTLLGLGTVHEPTTYREITRRTEKPAAEQTG